MTKKARSPVVINTGFRTQVSEQTGLCGGSALLFMNCVFLGNLSYVFATQVPHWQNADDNTQL